MKTFHDLSLEERLNVSHQNLERMRRPNGGYIASPYTAEDGSGDAYNVFWICDIMFATYANEYLAAAQPKEFEIPHEVRHRREAVAPILAVRLVFCFAPPTGWFDKILTTILRRRNNLRRR
jgi:hypothetical protein